MSHCDQHPLRLYPTTCHYRKPSNMTSAKPDHVVVSDNTPLPPSSSCSNTPPRDDALHPQPPSSPTSPTSNYSDALERISSTSSAAVPRDDISASTSSALREQVHHTHGAPAPFVYTDVACLNCGRYGTIQGEMIADAKNRPFCGETCGWSYIIHMEDQIKAQQKAALAAQAAAAAAAQQRRRRSSRRNRRANNSSNSTATTETNTDSSQQQQLQQQDQSVHASKSNRSERKTSSRSSKSSKSSSKRPPKSPKSVAVPASSSSTSHQTDTLHQMKKSHAPPKYEEPEEELYNGNALHDYSIMIYGEE